MFVLSIRKPLLLKIYWTMSCVSSFITYNKWLFFIGIGIRRQSETRINDVVYLTSRCFGLSYTNQLLCQREKKRKWTVEEEGHPRLFRSWFRTPVRSVGGTYRINSRSTVGRIQCYSLCLIYTNSVLLKLAEKFDL